MKLLSVLLVTILFIQAFVEASTVSDAPHSLSQTAITHAQEDAVRRQERTCVIEHARAAVKGAIAFHQELMATKTSAPAMPI
ncbi:hypothetical protein Sango_2333800 [Sesamum angolense]|uniref:Uncharacterized protein n=1 Tax=Sesamum angolense TaxID=2727404 RepID=A0AAE2BJ40_9LAMI|nr:hypothetical protein Sango_2333800 [Sesamum angolense]